MLTPFVCTNCGFWQRHFAPPATCPVCTDFRHTPPADGFRFLRADEAARALRCRWREDANGVVTFWTEPRLGIGPSGTLLPHPAGNIVFESPDWWSDEALDFLAARGGVRWLAASHPHAYASAWRVQERFSPQVAVQVEDLAWTGSLCVSHPFDAGLELAPGVALLHTGGHFAGHAVLHWAERRLLFAGDMLKFHFDPAGALAGISTHKAFNRRVPMSHAEIRRYRAVVEALDFDGCYTTFEHAPGGTRALALRLFDAQLAGAPFFGPMPVEKTDAP